MKVADLKKSRYLAKEDCHPPLLLTIERVVEENVAMEGQPRDMRGVMYFREDVKPMILNPTNGALIERFTGQDDTDNWRGAQVVCYDDPNVTFGGKLVGGIRVRAPKFRQPQVPTSQLGNTQPHPLPELPRRPVAPYPPPPREPPPREFDESLDAMYGEESPREVSDDDIPY